MTYIKGKAYGMEQYYYADGLVVSMPYINNELHGKAKWQWNDGRAVYAYYLYGVEVTEQEYKRATRE